jgi:ParB-like chromosome segregation protein Spo0J
MVYKIRVSPKHEREAQIASCCSATTDRAAFYEYQNSAQQLPVIRVPIELPIYRMANGRTRTEQLKYVRLHQSAPTFFANGQENQDAQQAQHELLDAFSKEGTTSIMPIAKVLEEGKQTEPILITSSGIVVNGNRRLAAMRELYAAGDGKYAEFTHINCMVLPASASDKEIKEIEVRLQMQPETKLAYTWVNEALTIKDLMQSGFTREEITRDMRKDTREVMAVLQALGHAEVYLKDWKGQPEDYELVERGKQLFGDMARDLKDKVGEHLEVSRRIGFLIQDNSSRLGTRAYAFNFSFGKKAPDVAEALAGRLGIDLNQPPPTAGEQGGQLEIDIDDESEGSSYRPLIDVMDDQSRREEVTQELIAVCESMRASEEDQKRGQAALKAVKDANTKLLEVDFSGADPDTYGAIDAQLHSVMLTAQKLSAEIARMITAGRSSTPRKA